MPLFETTTKPHRGRAKRSDQLAMKGEDAVPWLTVVGIGEDGVNGLGRAARRTLLALAIIPGVDRTEKPSVPPTSVSSRPPTSNSREASMPGSRGTAAIYRAGVTESQRVFDPVR